MEHWEWDKYSEDYHEYVISPLKDDVRNPLYGELKSMTGTVADVGTGRGELLPYLSKRFDKVFAIDFSRNMLKIARRNNKSLGNVVFRHADIRELTRLGLKFDVVIAVNSILHPEFSAVDRSIKEIHSTLTKGGHLKAIFPSMEAVLYHFQLVYEREFSKFNDDARALRSTKKIVERKKYNLIKCTFNDRGETQKLYYKFELQNRLAKAGFKSVQIKKVFYPWGSGDYGDFQGMPEMWDWYVSARK